MMKKDGLVVEGHRGTWYVLETKEVHGFELTLLEHETYGEDAAALIVGEGKNGLVVVAETTDGWNDVPNQFTLMKHLNGALYHRAPYPLIYGTYNGGILCADCAGEEPENIEAYHNYYEGAPIECDGGCGTHIASAYGDPYAEDEEEENA